MIEKNCMISFNNLDEFTFFYEELNIPSNWKITSENINKRGIKIYNKQYANQLRELFSSKNMFRRNVSIAEIVSWIDSYTLLMRLIYHLKKTLPNSQYERIKLHCEYKISMSKNRRIDFIFTYENRLLLTEFRLSDKFPNVSNIWQKKELELIIYKELLYNYLSPDYKILIFAFIAMPEYDMDNELTKQKKYNTENILFFANYISLYLLGNSAIEGNSE